MAQSNLISGKYLLHNKVGEGSFGAIYKASNTYTRQPVAIKIESNKGGYSQLLYEYKIYKAIEGGYGIPSTECFGAEKEYNFMVVQLLGSSLEDLFSHNKNKFSLQTVLLLCDQMLMRLEYLHSKNYIHRDIKPDNFCVGADNNKQIYLIDYGLATKYKDHRTGEHIKHGRQISLTGTARYASLNAHLGYDQSRRDDLESLGYTDILS